MVAGETTVIHLVRRRTLQELMLPMLVAPVCDQVEFQLVLFLIEGHDDFAEQFLQRADEAFDNGNAAVLADRAKPWADVAALAPPLLTPSQKVRRGSVSFFAAETASNSGSSGQFSS